MTKKFNVHLFIPVRFKVPGVEAASPALAMKKANDAAFDFHLLIDDQAPHCVADGLSIESMEYSEDSACWALVDPLDANGEVEYDEADWIDQQGRLFVNGTPEDEIKAALLKTAQRFFAELLEAEGAMTDIVEQYGNAALMGLFYLQNAILDGAVGALDVTHDSAVCAVIRRLPSAKEWETYLKFGA